MTYKFNDSNKKKIVEHFGIDFFMKIEGLMNKVKVRWHISELHLVDSFSANLIFEGISKTHGPVIVKFARHLKEFKSEVEALMAFDSKATCRLIEVDEKNGVLLEEAIKPGTTLFSEDDMDKRLRVFCDLFEELHGNHKNHSEKSDNRQSYKDWIVNITDYMEKQESWEKLTAHMKAAKDLYFDLSKDYSSQTLLHGDFHYYNILKAEDGYKIIDPKGVMGHPIFDIPRYMLNEYWDEKNEEKIAQTMKKVFSTLSDTLNIPHEVLGKLLYIEGAMAMCWCVQDGMDHKEEGDVLKSLERIRSYMQ